MEKSAVPDSLLVVWTSGDREVAQKMVFMYCKNSKLKNWWSRVRLVIWGPSAQLLAKDKDLQNELEELKAAGVELQACKACADLYGVTDQLRSLGIEVIYMGAPLTEMLKTGWTCLTF
ncbi:MAG: DsrE family protein [Desulfobaccales bacterium]